MHDEVRHLAAVQEQIVYTISHDLQTPLVGIRGAVHNLLHGLVGPLTDQQREYLEMVEASARRLSELTSSMCRSARRKVSGRPAQEPVDLKEATEAAVAGLRPAIVRKSLNLRIEAESEVWPARAERTRMIRIFANLLDNAVKHSPERGTIWVDIRSDKERPDWLHVLVEDEGPGIPKHQQESVFTRSPGLRAAAGSRGSASGLGLAVCRESVEAFGGRIWLEGDTGRGARFHLVIPAAVPVRGAV
jgi:signal transduction histidine kinase